MLGGGFTSRMASSSALPAGRGGSEAADPFAARPLPAVSLLFRCRMAGAGDGWLWLLQGDWGFRRKGDVGDGWLKFMKDGWGS